MALFRALIGKSRLSLSLTAQPMTRREYKSMITARYSQPAAVQS